MAGELACAAVASVVPEKERFLTKEIPRRLGLKTLRVKDLPLSIRNRYRKPRQVGIDRLMNAVAARRGYRGDLVVVDFGTATTLDVVTRHGEYLGGVIAPGVDISLEALFQKTALLPKVRLRHPRSAIGRDTVESIRSGCAWGIGGLCDALIGRIERELGRRARVVATGGYADFMKKYSQRIRRIDPDLTLKGIFLTCQGAKKFAAYN